MLNAGVLCSRFPSARSLRLLRGASATRSFSSFSRHRMSLRITSPTRNVSSVPRDHLITRSRGHVFYIRCGSLCLLRRIVCGMLYSRHTCRVRSWTVTRCVVDVRLLQGDTIACFFFVFFPQLYAGFYQNFRFSASKLRFIDD